MPVISSVFAKIGVELRFSSRKYIQKLLGTGIVSKMIFHCKYLSQMHLNTSTFADM